MLVFRKMLGTYLVDDPIRFRNRAQNVGWAVH